ncbi:MAG: SufE family protein [Prevotellaceae bacterium]|jgi:cysteine desulfuration protein SufE|nr:SufE family protein [Prevotellaceae bacterium]
MSDYTIEDIQNAIIEEFTLFDEWMDKYEYLIELGRNMEPYDPKFKTNDCLIDGCQSRVWVYGIKDGDKIIYHADSDAIITKGIISLLIRVFSRQKPSDILSTDLFFIEKIGLKENLSPTRSNGLLSMIKRMKDLALQLNSL